MERLQKILAAAGFGSRRKAEELIKQGLVTVNGEIAELGRRADARVDDIRVSGKRIHKDPKVYYLLNKPKGFLCTLKDPFERPKVVDLVPGNPRVFPVGRLDFDTTGALLLTNDGNIANKLMHPRYGVEKTYLVSVRGKLKPEDFDRLKAGVMLNDGPTNPAEVSLVQAGFNWTKIILTINEGRNRQVKRMLGSLGYPVLTLHREKFGILNVDKLQTGQYRMLRNEEIQGLRESVKR